MDDIVRTKVSNREKVLTFSYLGFVGSGPLGTSLLEDLGVDSFWMQLLLFVLFLVVVLALLTFLAVRLGQQRLAADRRIGVFTCAVRFPSSTLGSLRHLWDDGAARVSDDGLAFQPQQGQFHAKPAGKKRDFGQFTVLETAEMTGKKPRAWGRGWSVRELRTDVGRIQLAASSKSWSLIEEHLDREPRETK